MDENLCVSCEKMIRFEEAAKLIVAAFPKSLVICEACSQLERLEAEEATG